MVKFFPVSGQFAKGGSGPVRVFALETFDQLSQLRSNHAPPAPIPCTAEELARFESAVAVTLGPRQQ